MTEADLTAWSNRIAGAFVGLILGLVYGFVITSRIVKLGATMGVKVLQAERLTVFTSREYQNLKKRMERAEKHLGLPQGDDLEEEGLPRGDVRRRHK